MTLPHKVQKEAGRVAREQSLSPQVYRLFGWKAHLVEGSVQTTNFDPSFVHGSDT